MAGHPARCSAVLGGIPAEIHRVMAVWRSACHALCTSTQDAWTAL